MHQGVVVRTYSGFYYVIIDDVIWPNSRVR